MKSVLAILRAAGGELAKLGRFGGFTGGVTLMLEGIGQEDMRKTLIGLTVMVGAYIWSKLHDRALRQQKPLIPR